MSEQTPAHFTPPALGRRIAVVGTSGCGKSYVARALAQRLGIRYINNDELIWCGNWTPATAQQRLDRFVEALSGDAWTLDGNFGSLRHPEDQLVFERMDTLVWLDLPRHEVFRQVLGRTIRRCWMKEPLFHGNRETWRRSFLGRDSILYWSWTTFSLRKRQYRQMLERPDAAHFRCIRLSSRRAVDAWLAGVAAG